ncbi:MAG TPA: helicase-related protein [Caldisericia bacterium]|nr:helicase-related protein [Caldisericia bacterium]
MIELKQGMIISCDKWREPVEINYIEKCGDYFKINVTTTLSKETFINVLNQSDIDSINIETQATFFTEEALKIFLGIETLRYRYASLYDPLLAMNTSKVDPLPHQIEAVYGYVLKLPRIRFLIADDPGAGKTIMAGLIIKELKIRNMVKRILIVTPGHLKDQWRRELKDRFEENFIVIDRAISDAFYRDNVWQRENQMITSIDFAKRDEILPSIGTAHYDLIIVDEAHKMSATKYGENLSKTGRYKLGERLSRSSDHLLFLTATPHKGDPDNFRLFLDLLEPGFFATNDMVKESLKNKDNPLFIRRVKEDLKDFEGKPLFLPRYTTTVSFELKTESPAEQELYNELSEYVNTEYNKALQGDKKRNVAFALVILQRRFASSVYALFRSLERRKEKLQSLLDHFSEYKDKLEKNIDMDLEEVEDFSEEERWKEEEKWETLSVSENEEELRKEIQILKVLMKQAEDIIKSENEIKLKKLRETLNKLYQTDTQDRNKKVLIFTESKDTLTYLVKKVTDWGFKVNFIHGGMNLESRVEAESIFKNESDLMIATEAAGEGINLQFCHLMINYDIPWNPNRLEQRMGRVHRYGQKYEVNIYNLVATDTREGQVLTLLFKKLEEIKETMGNDKVYDVMGDVLADVDLSQLMIEAASSCRNMEDILKSINIKIDKEYVQRVKENLSESLATRYIDYTRIKEMADKAKEHRLIPEYTENFFKKTFQVLEGKIKPIKDNVYSIDSVPFVLKQVAERDQIKKVFGSLLRRYPKVTFDKEISYRNGDTEFVTFGHPMFEAMLTYTMETFAPLIYKGATFLDPDGIMDGYLLFYEGEIRDATGKVAGKRLFGIYCGKNNNQLKEINPTILWDLIGSKNIQPENCEINSLKQLSEAFVINELERYKKELEEERNHQAHIKEKYGIKSLEQLILKLDGDLIALAKRKENYENVDLAIQRKKETKNYYEASLTELIENIKNEKNLNMNAPFFKGLVRVIPYQYFGKHMVSDPEIEKIGMDTVMAYEKQNGRIPTDVSKENLGFDIRSIDPINEIRYIEVKARAQTGQIELTQNEWFMAKRFQNNYYLYVVFQANNHPFLSIIQNPAETLQAEEKNENVRYIVPPEEILLKGKTGI